MVGMDAQAAIGKMLDTRRSEAVLIVAAGLGIPQVRARLLIKQGHLCEQNRYSEHNSTAQWRLLDKTHKIPN